MRQLAFDVFAGADKVLCIVIVFFDTGRHREDIRVKDNIFRREADLFGEDFVGATANLNFTFAGVGLTNLVESHHHHRGAVAANQFRMVDKGFDALFHRDGVNDAFSLNAFQALFNDFPLGGVNHDRHAGNVRLAGNQVKETHHRRFRVEHPLVHVDIDNLRAAFHLLTRNVQRFAVLLFFNQPLKFRRAGDVSSFTDVNEQAIVADIQRLQAGEAAGHRNFRQLTRRQARYRPAHGGDMLRGGTAAAANDIEETGFRPFANLRRHGVGVQIVFAEGVGQAGVRVRGDVAFGNARQLLDVLPQLVRPEGAVQTKR